MASANTLISLLDHPLGPAVRESQSFTRPSDTTTYTSGDLVANSTTASSCIALAFSLATKRLVNNGEWSVIQKIILRKTSTTISNAVFSVHLYRRNPFSTDPTNGDNGVLKLTGVVDDYIGSATSLNQSGNGAHHTDGSLAASTDAIPFQPVDGAKNIYAVIECNTAYVPTSAEVFTVDILFQHL